MLAMPSKQRLITALAAVVGIVSLAAVASAQEGEADYDIDYARSISPWRGPIGAATNWGADLPGEFNPALGYYGSYGYWGYGTAGGFHFWDLGGPHRPPLRALHGNWWWQSGMHPYDLYDAVIALRNQRERQQMLEEDLPPVPGVQLKQDHSLLIVQVPAAARVFINDRATTSTGERPVYFARYARACPTSTVYASNWSETDRSTARPKWCVWAWAIRPSWPFRSTNR